MAWCLDFIFGPVLTCDVQDTMYLMNVNTIRTTQIMKSYFKATGYRCYLWSLIIFQLVHEWHTTEFYFQLFSEKQLILEPILECHASKHFCIIIGLVLNSDLNWDQWIHQDKLEYILTADKSIYSLNIGSRYGPLIGQLWNCNIQIGIFWGDILNTMNDFTRVYIILEILNQ